MHSKLEECDMQFALATNSLVVCKVPFGYNMDRDQGINREPHSTSNV
jgi:hypothetical protein